MKTFIWLIALSFSLLPMQLLAQGQGGKKEQIEAKRIAFYTEKLDLSRSEAEVFWPVYREMNKQLLELRKEMKSQRKGNVSEISDNELEKLLDDMIDFKQKELDVKKRYHEEFKDILPIRKVAKLYHAEEQFKKRMQSSKSKPSGGPQRPPR